MPSLTTRLRPLALLPVLGFTPSLATAALTPVFSYSFPESYEGETAADTTVTDLSPAAQNGTVSQRDNLVSFLYLNEDVPPGAAAGSRSLDLGFSNGTIRTNGKKLLDRAAVLAAGGFTLNVAFKGVPASGNDLQKIIDDTGYDFISVNGGDHDGDGQTGQAVVRVGADGPLITDNTYYLDVDDGLSLTEWNRITVSFTVTGGTAEAPTGDVAVILNGVVRRYPGKTLTANAAYGGLDRPVAIGSHPAGFEYYQGFIHNPSVSLGADPIVLPSLILDETTAGGFTATVTDGGTSAVDPDSVSAVLNDEPIEVSATRNGSGTVITWQPQSPLPGGVHQLSITFSDASGPMTETRTFYLIGNDPAPVFQYHFPASNDGGGLSAEILDQSPAAHHGVISGTCTLSEDVPPLYPEDSRSLDLTAGTARIVSNDRRLLERSKVLAAGGYTMDLWFKGVPTDGSTTLKKLMDYAGTEHIAVNGADHDHDGTQGQVFVNIFGAPDMVLDADDGLLTDAWNHITASFRVTAASGLSTLTGTTTVTLNGRTFTRTGVELNNFGDTLDRSTGVAAHPGGIEIYNGLLYNTDLYLGVPAVPAAPAASITASRATGTATLTLTDGAGGPPAEGTLTVLLDGKPVTPAGSITPGTTILTLTPETPWSGGRHHVTAFWRDTSGAPHYHSLPFVILGRDRLAVLDYTFPASYSGQAGNEPVYDQSGAGHDGKAVSTVETTPLALSSEVPPGAAAGTQSLDFGPMNGAILTDGRKLLNRPQITAHGGFEMEVWFKGVQGETVQKILDYAGTEYIGVRATDTDADGHAGEVLIGLSDNPGFLILDADNGLDVTGWNHLIFRFRVADESNPAALAGEGTAILNGVSTSATGTLTDFGDTLDRVISLGRHPVAHAEFYRGLLYSPSVRFGVPVPDGAASISLTRTATHLEITFEGVLQTSTTLSGWQDAGDAVSPHQIPLPVSGARFYRARPAEPAAQ